jgi:hypothetical protein
MRTNTASHQQVKESSDIENREVTLKTQSGFNLYAGKLTAVYHWGENSQLEAGGEHNRIEGDGRSINPEQYFRSSFYTNSEEKTAGFINYNQVFGKLNFQLGIRYESVRSKATEDSTRQVKTNRKYHGFYPSLSLSQTVGNTQMGLELSRKTKRPDFSVLNSSDLYINRFLLEKGNPYLQNEDIYQVDYHLSYTIFDFSAGYVYKKNAIEFTLENLSSQTLFTYINYPKYQELNALFTAHPEWKIWKPRITAGLHQPFFSVDYLGEKRKRNRTSLLLQFYNEIVFPKEYILSVNFDYLGKSNNYVMERKALKSLNLGIRKSFFDKKLSFNLQAYDVFKWISRETIAEINNVSYVKKTDQLESRYLTLTIGYHFNNYKKKYRGENAAREDIERL